MKLPRPAGAAKAHNQHLAHAAFYTALERGVRFNAVDGDDGVYRKGRIKHVGGEAVCRLPNAAAGGAGYHLGPKPFFGNIQAVQHFLLPLGRAAAVAAHGRQQHRGCAAAAHHSNHGLKHGAYILYAPAANGYTHRAASLDARRKQLHLCSHFCCGIIHSGPNKRLTYARHGRQGLAGSCHYLLQLA